jgi:uncharacterized SAM-binding protein YcdF (DUF218 family)
MHPHPKLVRTLLYVLIPVFLLALWMGGLYSFTRDMFAAQTEARNAQVQTVQNAATPAPPAADAIVVLTGGSNRLKTGFDLLEQKRGHKLFISGVYQGVDVKTILERMKRESPSEFDCCVVLGFDAYNTVSNARETAAWMHGMHYKTLYLVTAHYHMKRALMDFNRVAPDLVVYPYPAAPDGLDMEDWWRDGRYRSLVIREYMKYLLTAATYAVLPRSIF